MKVLELQKIFESFAPLSVQESYDNAGLHIGNPQDEISKILFTIDVTEAVIDEAIAVGADCVVSHHPLIFKGLQRITGATEIERCVKKAIQHSIVLYCAHTNLDSVYAGVNYKICEKLGIKNPVILAPKDNALVKIVTFVPHAHTDTVRNAMAHAGAGVIGNYDTCSFSMQGQGSFRAQEGAQPFVGNVHELHVEQETRLEMIAPLYVQSNVISALIQAHPYQEVAYDVYTLKNTHPYIGSGMIGELETSYSVTEFLSMVKSIFSVPCIRYSEASVEKITRVAVCGGAGSFLIPHAKKAKADIFITGDVKYHDFFLPENKMIIADIGHYESEQFTKEIFYEIVRKNFPKFATHFSTVNTNPIKYL